jgi:hypothetical protein
MSVMFGRSLTGGAKKPPFPMPALLSTKNEGAASAKTVAQRARDTDGDGLSDMDELFYGTNPFKADTDGDGLSDGDEVRSGSNPRGYGGLYDFGVK